MKGTIITSPEAIRSKCNRSIFLAGGISNCPDWQKEAAQRIADSVDDCIVYNPRRNDFDMAAYEEVSRQQIIWEYHALRMSTANLFWFPEETLCPITLFEYGSAIERLHAGAVMCGTHINYQRRFDLIEQTRLRSGMPILDNLDTLIKETIILLKSIPA